MEWFYPFWYTNYKQLTRGQRKYFDLNNSILESSKIPVNLAVNLKYAKSKIPNKAIRFVYIEDTSNLVLHWKQAVIIIYILTCSFLFIKYF